MAPNPVEVAKCIWRRGAGGESVCTSLCCTLAPLCVLSLICLLWHIGSLLAARPVKDTCPSWHPGLSHEVLGQKAGEAWPSGTLLFQGQPCPGWAAGEGPQWVPDNSCFCFLLLLSPLLLRGKTLQRAVVGAGLKAGRGGSLHGSSTQAGRKWPCAKAGSGCCQTGRGGWVVGEAGTNPVERWVGRGSALAGLSCSPGTVSSVVTGRRMVSREKAIFVTTAPANVLSP